MSETGIAERAKAVNRLTALKLDGGAYQMLSDICKAVYPHNGAWTFSECENLRYQLAWLMHNLNMDRFDNEMWKQGYDEGYASADDILGREENGVLAEHGFVRLPKDADGEYIHLGDVMEWCDSGDTLEVVGIGADDTLFYFDKDSDGEEMADWTSARNKRHHHAPTVEDVLRDMHAKLDEVTALYVGEAIDSDERDGDEARIFAEYAAKLRLAGDAE